MKRNAGINVPAGWLIALAAALLAANAANAADAASGKSPPLPSAPEDELQEIVVSGQKPIHDSQKVIDWLARLVGKFTFDGHVDLHGQGRAEDQQPVHGNGDCVGFGPAPAVNCTISVAWPETHGPNGEEIPGGVSRLNPAMMLYGFEPDHIGIRYMLVDDKGTADGALGLMVGDTLVSKTPCVGIPGNCQREVRITAPPDLKTIRMQIDLEMDTQRTLSYVLLMHRLPGNNAVVISGQKR